MLDLELDFTLYCLLHSSEQLFQLSRRAVQKDNTPYVRLIDNNLLTSHLTHNLLLELDPMIHGGNIKFFQEIWDVENVRQLDYARQIIRDRDIALIGNALMVMSSKAI